MEKNSSKPLDPCKGAIYKRRMEKAAMLKFQGLPARVERQNASAWCYTCCETRTTAICPICEK